MSFAEVIALASAALLAENVLLVRFLGAGALARQYGGFRRSLASGLTLTVFLLLAVPLAWLVDTFLLRPWSLEYLRLVAFLLIIALLERILNLIVGKLAPLQALVGELLPLAAVNSAVLGGALSIAQKGLGLPVAELSALFGGLGFTLAALLLASIRGRLAFSDCPKAFRGIPIALVSIGLLAMAFLGFGGLPQ